MVIGKHPRYSTFDLGEIIIHFQRREQDISDHYRRVIVRSFSLQSPRKYYDFQLEKFSNNPLLIRLK